jgi:exopolysaccharide production protein ExoQ
VSTVAIDIRRGEERCISAQAASCTLPITALVLTIGFFLAGHDLHVSQAVAYTQTAEEMELAAAGGNPLRRVAFAAVAAWGLALFLTGQRRVRVDPVLAGGVTALLALTAASFLWADDPGMCLRRMFALVCCTIAAVGVARSLSLREINWLAVLTLGALAVVGVLAELKFGTFRPWAGDYRFAGTVHPNTQGPALATLLLAAYGLARQGGRWRFALYAVCAAAFVLLLLTKSRTTTAAVLVALGAVHIVQTPLRTKVAAATALAWCACFGLWLVWVLGFDPLTDFRDAILLGRAEESDTLSGRAFIWPEVMYFALQRPLLGFGYESFWTPGRIETISTNLGWGLREAHNGYLETLLSLGVVGLALLLLVVASGLAASVRGYVRSRDSVYALPLGLTVFGLINAGLESGMVVINLVPFLLACLFLQFAFFGEGKTEHMANKCLTAENAERRRGLANVETRRHEEHQESTFPASSCPLSLGGSLDPNGYENDNA